MRAHAVDGFARGAPLAVAHVPERAPLLLVQHEGAEAPLAQAARIEHPARLVDQPDDAHGRAAVPRQRADLVDQLAADAADTEQDDVGALRTPADLAAADLVEVEGVVHRAERRGHLSPSTTNE